MRRTLNAMPSDETPICRACGEPIKENAARYRTPAGDTHVHCHNEPRVLVIEDDSALREFIVGMVKRIGYIADEAANGQEAIERLPRYPYDVILCALRMPGDERPGLLSRDPKQISWSWLTDHIHDRACRTPGVCLLPNGRGCAGSTETILHRRASSRDSQPGPNALGGR